MGLLRIEGFGALGFRGSRVQGILLNRAFGLEVQRLRASGLKDLGRNA